MRSLFIVIGLLLSTVAPAAAQQPGTAPPPATPPSAERKACTDAMNADPTFAKAIVDLADKQAAEARLRADLEQHTRADAAIQKNERHVILAYAAMWVCAAAFLVFLWLRQQALRAEMARLRRDLEAAARDGA